MNGEVGPKARPKWAWYDNNVNGANLRLGRVALHEFGHAVHLSTRNRIEGEVWGHEAFDFWLKTELSEPAIAPCEVVSSNGLNTLENWKQASNQCRPDRLMWIPLMHSSGLGAKALYRNPVWQRAFGDSTGRWTRHEDWNKANEEALKRN